MEAGLRREAGRMVESGKTVLVVLRCLLAFCLLHSHPLPPPPHWVTSQNQKGKGNRRYKRGPKVGSLWSGDHIWFSSKGEKIRLLKGRKETERRERLERTGRAGT